MSNRQGPEDAWRWAECGAWDPPEARVHRGEPAPRQRRLLQSPQTGYTFWRIFIFLLRGFSINLSYQFLLLLRKYYHYYNMHCCRKGVHKTSLSNLLLQFDTYSSTFLSIIETLLNFVVSVVLPSLPPFSEFFLFTLNDTAPR